VPTIETLTVDVKANTSKLSSGLKSAGVALAGLGAAAVVTFRAFEDAEAVSKQTDAVIKSTGASANVTAAQVEGLATSLSKKSGVDDEVIQSGENMLLTFKNIRNEAGAGNDIFNQTASVALDMAAGMAAASGGAVDMKSTTIQLGKALNDPVAGISALSRVGVTFTNQQKKQIATMVKAGDTLGAQKIILGEVKSEFAGSAAANKTSSMTMATAFGNLQEAIGGVVAGAMVPLLAIMQPVIDLMTRYPGVVAAIVVGLTALFVATKLYTAVTATIPVIQALIAATNPFILIAAAVGILAIIVVKNWTTIKNFILKVWNVIKNSAPFKVIAAIVGTYIKVMIGYFKVLWAIIKIGWNIIKTVAVAVWKVISGSVKANILIIKTVFNAVKSALIAGWNAIKAIGVGIWNTIKGAAVSAFNFIISMINSAINGVNTLINGFNRVPGVPDIPTIPTLAKGGVVLSTGLAVVHEGERFSGVGNDFGGGGVTVNVYGSVMAEHDLAATIQKALLRSKARSGALGLA
jgi:hypothetical protein